jgi:hypothetical protein
MNNNDDADKCNIQSLKDNIIILLKCTIKKSDCLSENDKNKNLFKLIYYTFQSLSNLIKFLLLHVNDKNYKLANTKKIIFPDSIDNLIIILATFDKAFDDIIVEKLFNLLDFSSYSMLYKISNINPLMLPFVINDETDYTKIELVFKSFKLLVNDFVCYVLNLNIYLEPSIVCKLDSFDNNQSNYESDSCRKSIIKDKIHQLENVSIKDKIHQLEHQISDNTTKSIDNFIKSNTSI